MAIELSVFEKSVVIRALIDYKRKIWQYAEMTEEDKDLLRGLYKDCNKILKKLEK